MPDRATEGVLATIRNLVSRKPRSSEMPGSTIDLSSTIDRLLAVRASASGIDFPSKAVPFMAGLLQLPDNRSIQIGDCWEIPEDPNNSGHRVGYIIGQDHEGQQTVHIKTGAAEASNPQAIILVTYASSGAIDNVSVIPLSSGARVQEDSDKTLKTIDPGKQGFIDPGIIYQNGDVARRGLFIVGGQRYEILKTNGITDKATKTRLSFIIRPLSGQS